MKENETIVTDFILTGFSMLKEIKIGVFIFIFIAYINTIFVNIIIIALIYNEENLHKPMFFFIGGLSFLEIWYPSVTVPKLLGTLIAKEQSISHVGCMCQLYFHFSLGATENILLAIMAYDRYVAICIPLRYITIMNPSFCWKLLLASWFLGMPVLVAICIQVSKLSFCNHKVIDHYYCDFAPLIRISCSDISNVKMLFFVTACLVILGCLLVIILSYIFILQTAMSFPTSFGRSKAFSTCASHLIVVSLFYGTTIVLFLRPNTSDVLPANKFISIFPSVVTPVLNPVIYTLRNQEVRETAKKSLERMKCFQDEKMIL